MWYEAPPTWNIVIYVHNSMVLLLIREFSKTVFFTLRFVIAIGLLLFCICNWNLYAIWFMSKMQNVEHKFKQIPELRSSYWTFKYLKSKWANSEQHEIDVWFGKYVIRALNVRSLVLLKVQSLNIEHWTGGQVKCVWWSKDLNNNFQFR